MCQLADKTEQATKLSFNSAKTFSRSATLGNVASACTNSLLLSSELIKSYDDQGDSDGLKFLGYANMLHEDTSYLDSKSCAFIKLELPTEPTTNQIKVIKCF